MAESQSQSLKDFFATLDAILSKTDEDITQGKRLGTENSFEQLLPDWSQAKRLVERLKACDYFDVPDSLIGNPKSYLDELLKSVKALQSFQPSTPNSRIGQINNFNQTLQQAANSIAPILAIGATNPTDTRRISQELLAEKERIVKELTAELEAAKSSSKDAHDAAAAAKEAATDAKTAAGATGALAEAKHFQMLSNTHWWWAIGWLCFSTVIAGTIIGIALHHFYNPYSFTPPEKWTVLQMVVSKLIIISILSFLLVFSVRNYNTRSHNYVVNEHRAKALTTFQTFVSGTANEKTKDAVLLLSCRAVFGHQTSGFLRKEGETSGLPIVDFVKPLVSR